MAEMQRLNIVAGWCCLAERMQRLSILGDRRALVQLRTIDRASYNVIAHMLPTYVIAFPYRLHTAIYNFLIVWLITFGQQWTSKRFHSRQANCRTEHIELSTEFYWSSIARHRHAAPWLHYYWSNYSVNTNFSVMRYLIKKQVIVGRMLLSWN